MRYQVTLHNGQGFIITLSGENPVDVLTDTLNQRETVFINLGGCIVQKNTVATILPIQETENTK